MITLVIDSAPRFHNGPDSEKNTKQSLTQKFFSHLCP